MNIPLPFPNINDNAVNDVQTWSSNKILNYLKPVLDTQTDIYYTYEGAIANFTTDTVQPFVKCDCQILPIQEGTGTPSPSNPRPISGTSALNVTRAGKNLFDKTAISSQKWLSTTTGLEEPAVSYCVSNYIPVEVGKTVFIPSSGTARRWFYDTNKNPVTYLNNSGNQAYTPNTDGYIRVSIAIAGSDAKDINIYQIELGSTATTYEAYNAETYTIDLGQTIYGGSAEVVGGTGSETHGYIASYNGEAINEPWLSSIDPYAQGTTPSIGAEVVYPLTTPESFTFDGVRVESLEGINNIWTDTGDIKVTTSETDTIGNILKERGILP